MLKCFDIIPVTQTETLFKSFKFYHIICYFHWVNRAFKNVFHNTQSGATSITGTLYWGSI